MRDDSDLSHHRDAPAMVAAMAHASAIIIPFPVRPRSRPPAQVAPAAQVTETAVAGLLSCVVTVLDPRAAAHAPTRLAAIGAIAGFAAQQSLLLEGGAAWAQPKRAGHLDRLLLSGIPAEPGHGASLWFILREAATTLGVQYLPDPKPLLAATLKCVGTTQLGVITMPLEYKLIEQPQGALTAVWRDVRATLQAASVSSAAWPCVAAAACGRSVLAEQRQVPPHVALRIVLQSALAMALIEPRLVLGADTKSGPH